MSQSTCSVASCAIKPAVRGWCNKHYLRWRKTGDPLLMPSGKREGVAPICSVDGCDEEVTVSGYCTPHYGRWVRHGDPLAGRTFVAAGKRPAKRACAVDGCARKHHGGGYCERHGRSKREFGDPLELDKRKAERDARHTKGCVVPACGEVLKSGSHCYRHDYALKTQGDPEYWDKIQRADDALFAEGKHRCRRCDVIKALDTFPANKNGRYGVYAYCRECTAAWRAENPSPYDEAKREYSKAHYAMNRDAIREKHSQHYAENKEWYTDRTMRRRTAIRGNDYEPGITRTALRQRDGDTCPYCSALMGFGEFKGYESRRATIEHIMPLARGGSHSWGNVTLCCWECNLKKNDKTLGEWDVLDDGECIRKQSV